MTWTDRLNIIASAINILCTGCCVPWLAVLTMVLVLGCNLTGAARVTPTARSLSHISTAVPTAPLAVRADDDNNRLPAGGLSITEPAQTAQASYYKIAPHETITFGWEFTSLTATPSRLYVVASCSKNGNTYPIAPSPSGIPGDARSVTWYPYGYRMDAQKHGDPDLVADKYRLIIYDDKGPTGVAKGGEFQANNMAEFSMYFPKKYTPLSGTSHSRTTPYSHTRPARMDMQFVQRCFAHFATTPQLCLADHARRLGACSGRRLHMFIVT